MFLGGQVIGLRLMPLTRSVKTNSITKGINRDHHYRLLRSVNQEHGHIRKGSGEMDVI
jgi:hypothetical protein